MDNQSFLIFKVQDLHYALAAPQVREVLKLPALSPATNLPTDVIGVLNYRGQIVPVMHLAHRFGQAAPHCQASDSLIVIESQGLTVGMVVQRVEDVRTIEASDIQLGFSLGRDIPVQDVFLAGIATVADQMIMLLNPETLIREADTLERMSTGSVVPDITPESSPENKPENKPEGKPENKLEQTPESGPVISGNEADIPGALGTATHFQPVDFFARYCPQMSPQERELLQERAAALQGTQDEGEDSNLRSLAVMRLGEEYFGLDLEAVREFIKVPDVTPVPCCPSHIVGNINLRGEVMTLIDIRSTLNVSFGSKGEMDSPTQAEPAQSDSAQHDPDATSESAHQKAIVVDVDGLVAGIPVDRLYDIIYVTPESISSVPVTTASSRQDYLSGIAAHGDMMLSILDFPKLMNSENLVVNETV